MRSPATFKDSLVRTCRIRLGGSFASRTVSTVFPDVGDFLPTNLGLFVEAKRENLALRLHDEDKNERGVNQRDFRFLDVPPNSKSDVVRRTFFRALFQVSATSTATPTPTAMLATAVGRTDHNFIRFLFDRQLKISQCRAAVGRPFCAILHLGSAVRYSARRDHDDRIPFRHCRQS